MIYQSSLLVASFVLLSIAPASASEVPTTNNPASFPQPQESAKDWAMTAAIPLSDALPITLDDGTKIAQTAPLTPNPELKQEIKKNYVGITIGSIFQIPAYGINAKFGVADNISLRPFIQFASAPDFLFNSQSEDRGASINGYIFGVSATYDFNVANSDFTPYAGIGFTAASGTSSYPNNGTPSRESASASPLYVELGGDYNFTDNVILNANYKFSLTERLGFFSIGGGYRF